jgi:hypothetical protein
VRYRAAIDEQLANGIKRIAHALAGGPTDKTDEPEGT